MSPVWGWIVAYLLGFLGFQVLIYWYLQNGGAWFEWATPDSGESGCLLRTFTDQRNVEQLETAATIRCQYCGAINENHPSYTYCRECIRLYI